MITLKDIDETWDEGTTSEIDKLARKLLKQSDAYREVANQYRRLWVSESRYQEPDDHSQVIDEEAQQILESKQ